MPHSYLKGYKTEFSERKTGEGPGPGLREMIAAAKPGECPLCGDPLQEKKVPGRPGTLWRTCGDEVCRKAWWRYYSRDRQSFKKGRLPHALPVKAG